MKKILLQGFLLLVAVQSVFAQGQHSAPDPAAPRLVVGLVIDQMRWDYLYRFRHQYTETGFNRLLGQGFSCENTMIPYVPTYTAPGHASIYTGSVPAVNGIIGNTWFNRAKNDYQYCTDDDSARTVGSESKAGNMSPDNLWGTTITDELRISKQFAGKVIGVAIKDRSSILPAGHSANAAYWYDGGAGKMISSTYYMKELPKWVQTFNAADPVAAYMRNDWNTLLPLSAYTLSTEDNKPYEYSIKGIKTVTFPHKLSALTKEKYEAFKTTPYGSSYTLDFARAAVRNEQLGRDEIPDFLAVSLSSPDYIGHAFGPNSVEIQDTYLRLDRDIASFLQFLDSAVGQGKYLFFLTADHGVAHVPGFLHEHGIPGGGEDDQAIKKQLEEIIRTQTGVQRPISNVINYQVYLADSVRHNENVREAVIAALKQLPAVATAVDLEELPESVVPEPMRKRLINGYTPQRSGDIQFVFKPGYFDGSNKGTTHGLWNPYDSHIPLLFYGWGIRPGKLYRETYMTDIAPTLAALLKIQMPSGCVGQVIHEVLRP